MRVADAGYDLRAVGFDFHSPAAAVTLLPPPQLAVDRIERDGDARRKPGQRRDQALAVGLARGFKSQHQIKNLW